MGILRALRDGEYGLAWANVATYYKARRNSKTHDQALKIMVTSRYSTAPSTMQRVLESVSVELSDDSDFEDQPRSVIGLMYSLEAGIPSDYSRLRKRDHIIDEVLAIHRQKYPGIL